jgi:antitoxin MazE
MQVQIQKWGNSLAIRIPKSFAKEIEVDLGTTVDLSTVEGNLVAKPVKEGYSLEEMLDQVNEQNLHSEVDTGDAVGKEIW